MQITASLNKQINKAVQTSMRIEGYKPPGHPQSKSRLKPSWNSTVSKYQFNASDLFYIPAPIASVQQADHSQLYQIIG